MLEEFFAVTETSLYFICRAEGKLVLKELASKIENSISCKKVESEELMLSVGRRLIFFLPKGSENSFEKDVSKVSSQHWNFFSDCVIGLFLKGEDARSCFNNFSIDCQEKTKEVLEKIGKNNLYFSISSDRDFAL